MYLSRGQTRVIWYLCLWEVTGTWWNSRDACKLAQTSSLEGKNSVKGDKQIIRSQNDSEALVHSLSNEATYQEFLASRYKGKSKTSMQRFNIISLMVRTRDKKNEGWHTAQFSRPPWLKPSLTNPIPFRYQPKNFGQTEHSKGIEFCTQAKLLNYGHPNNFSRKQHLVGHIHL